MKDLEDLSGRMKHRRTSDHFCLISEEDLPSKKPVTQKKPKLDQLLFEDSPNHSLRGTIEDKGEFIGAKNEGLR